MDDKKRNFLKKGALAAVGLGVFAAALAGYGAAHGAGPARGHSRRACCRRGKQEFPGSRIPDESGRPCRAGQGAARGFQPVLGLHHLLRRAPAYRRGHGPCGAGRGQSLQSLVHQSSAAHEHARERGSGRALPRAATAATRSGPRSAGAGRPCWRPTATLSGSPAA